ncbi:ornithine carbamoyltransferase [Trinickia dinghuensis]|uniref:Ornithine carbamoyltransferase n=1 Tax=Trinickia dinghuensis TaxID=2291023 RepID=A0A3D8K124_9BURK|nr:ornithine carbamoyltransferase [Trinickia dinghuensis]RDU98988.1 ornithine carbamoyltransferase [Trinickia dinghuensis]
MKLISLTDLSAADIRSIWTLAGKPAARLSGNVAWSFEGNGIRTRSTFLQAFRALNLEYIELPNLLKTSERACDIAGYLDPLYDFYVIRESNHARLAEFAIASRRPVINAMSSDGHPCEVLTDAYYIDSVLMPIERARICLWGPTTNVFRSWHELAAVLKLQLVHVCDSRFHRDLPHVVFTDKPDSTADVVITDGWSKEIDAADWSLTEQHLAAMGNPKLLPTPPFIIGRELSFDPCGYDGFTGYEQKKLLVPVQIAVLLHMANCRQDTRS